MPAIRSPCEDFDRRGDSASRAESARRRRVVVRAAAGLRGWLPPAAGRDPLPVLEAGLEVVLDVVFEAGLGAVGGAAFPERMARCSGVSISAQEAQMVVLGVKMPLLPETSPGGTSLPHLSQ
ncbi:MAG: hypothetical protein ACYTKD_00445 [Planctomycetota bacterium]|jgi:hypothetical protein